jgi:uncharacterized membrane protein
MVDVDSALRSGDPMVILKVVHIVSMFAGVTILVGGEWFYLRAMRRPDVPAMRAFARIYGRLDRIGIGFLSLGVLFGLATAATGGFAFTAGWLVAAYVLVVALYVVGFASTPFLLRVGRLVEANSGDEPGPELAAAVRSPAPVVTAVVSIVLYVAVIADMVIKPF